MKKQSNERITENFVREHFKEDPLFTSIKLEEQKSYSQKINDLLQGASKAGGLGVGKPEFIITFPLENIDYLIIIECKASINHHKSLDLNKIKDYAVDGVLHYAKKLSKQFSIIAIAVSGQTKEELMISHFLWEKGAKEYQPKENDITLLSINSYIKWFENYHFIDSLKNVDIIKKAIKLNEEYHSYSITEITRCTIVSAILLSLLDKPFKSSYKIYSSSKEIGESLILAIQRVLNKNKIKHKDLMIAEYRKILNEPIFNHNEIKHKNKKIREKSVEVIKYMIEYLENNIVPLIDMEQSGFDVLGRFYTEFIRYAGSEQSQGLVLTPYHITDLFCDLAKINQDSIIYDPCCGTSGFLISGLKRMLLLSGNNRIKQSEIKKNQLIGIEIRPSMFTYACSNMMMRGDGKSNIYCNDCFVLENQIKQLHKPNVAFLNPPYDVGSAGQMKFIEHALNVVSHQNGIVVAIVQMSCAIKFEKELIEVKERIINKHTLKAVLSMPDDLFHPIGVVTCIMIFEANKKHSGKTWFGYFKNDGFEKRKYKGRIDAKRKWGDIKKQWLAAYNDLESIPGLSVKQLVSAHDEWCAEAYMETDYTKLTKHDFIKTLKEYVLFNELFLK